GDDVILHVDGTISHAFGVTIVEGVYINPAGAVIIDFRAQGQGPRGDGDQGGQHRDFGICSAIGTDTRDAGFSVDARGAEVFQDRPRGTDDLTDEPDDKPNPAGYPG